MRVLIAEDDIALQKGLHHVLSSAGHQVVVAGDGAHADTLLATEGFDLLVLDLGLPRLEGLGVLQRLRRRKQALPVLILTARDRAEERVEGLDAGADDYMTKPFDLPEFEARVRALLRRGQGASVQLGALEWSWDKRQARIGGDDIALSRNELALLEALLQTPGRIVAKDSLAQRFESERSLDAGNMVEVYIHRLRKKLDGAGVEVKTIRGLGYVLHETPRP